MLAKAVQQHDGIGPPPRRQATTLSQQLFPSSSPAANQCGLRSPFRNSVPPSNVLKPSTSSTVNAKVGYKNPLKRTASQTIEMGSYFSRESSRDSGSTQPSSYSKRDFVDLTQPSLIPISGVVGKLHEGVYFDENDFVDDADLDLDGDDEPPVQPLPASVNYPTLPAFENSPSSGVPLPWSSSPLQHRLPPDPTPNAGSSRYGNSPLGRPLIDDNTRVAKRRKLPWLDQNGDKSEQCKAGSLPSQKINHARKNMKGAYTPLPIDKASESPYPWNKTASAVKEEQKKHRQQLNQGKKLAKTVNSVAVAMDPATKKSKSRKHSVAKVLLSDEQRKVLDLVLDGGRSVFFTGSAGTGKSVLMREIIAVLRRKFQQTPDRVAVTASTGLAACNVGGVTLHSFGGIGLGKEDVPTLVKKIRRNQKAKARWQHTKVLIIDEISMVDGELFDKLEAIARSIKNNGRPFGGIQLVITGDFFQLPPVPDSNRVAKFAFEAATWTTSISHTIGLTQVFRQKDPVFADMLNEMRVGKLSQKSISTFHGLSRKLSFEDDLEATELFPTRQEVDNANSMRMRNLGGTSLEFVAEDGGAIQDIAQRDKLLSNCMAPVKITLKKGAQVLLIKNIDESLVNGSVGKVVGFMDEKTFDYYHENEEDFQADATQDNEEEMSRAKLKLKAMMVDVPGSTSKKWPLIRFHIADGTTRELLCQRETWKIELPNGEIQASRSQIPLILAWALSIHKAQGQTLDRVKVDLGKIFEKGQAYVALSRATCQEGLQVMRFDPKKVMAHDKVRAFYDSLYNVDQALKASEQVPRKGKGSIGSDYGQWGPESFEEDPDVIEQLYR